MTKFEIYTGKSGESTKIKYNGEEVTLGEKVVLELTNEFRNTNCLVTFDNFFSSVQLQK